MNSDFLESFLIKVIIAGGTAWATKHAVTIDGSDLQMFAGGLVAAGAAAYRLYWAYGQKKVPAAAVVLPPV